jgi:hypothetical protein
MDASTLDLIVRGRPTILEILSDRGYNVDAYKSMSADTLHKFATTNVDLLKIQATHENGTRVTVLYWVEGAVRLRLAAEVDKLWSAEVSDPYDPAGGGRGGYRAPYRTGFNDSDPYDPPGGGRGGYHAPYRTGISDSDPHDPPGGGRGGYRAPGYRSASDSDPRDPAGRGRRGW